MKYLLIIVAATMLLLSCVASHAQSSRAQVCFEASMSAGHAYTQRAAKTDKARGNARPEIPYVSDVPLENVLIMRGVNYGYFQAKSHEDAVEKSYASCVESTLWNERSQTVPVTKSASAAKK